jgi:hypothetical protein
MSGPPHTAFPRAEHFPGSQQIEAHGGDEDSSDPDEPSSADMNPQGPVGAAPLLRSSPRTRSHTAPAGSRNFLIRPHSLHNSKIDLARCRSVRGSDTSTGNMVRLGGAGGAGACTPLPAGDSVDSREAPLPFEWLGTSVRAFPSSQLACWWTGCVWQIHWQISGGWAHQQRSCLRLEWWGACSSDGTPRTELCTPVSHFCNPIAGSATLRPATCSGFLMATERL